MQKNILFISSHGDPLAPIGSEQTSGQNKYIKQLALALEKQGNHVDVITHWADMDKPRIERFGKTCRVIRVAAGHKGYVQKNEMYHLLVNFYQEMKDNLDLATYDIIHTHYWLSGLLGLKVKKKYNIPWVHTNHSLSVAKLQATELQEPIRFTSEKLILSMADRVIATAAYECLLIQSFVMKPSPIEVIAIHADDINHPFTEMENSLEVSPFMATLVVNEDYAKQLGQNTINESKRKYSWPKLSKQINELYEKTINGEQEEYVGNIRPELLNIKQPSTIH